MSELRSNSLASETFGSSRTEASPLVPGTRFDLHVGSDLPTKEEGLQIGEEFARQARAAIEAANLPSAEQAARLGAQSVSLVSARTTTMRRETTHPEDPISEGDHFRLWGRQVNGNSAVQPDMPTYELTYSRRG
jgi:hypothetical protein